MARDRFAGHKIKSLRIDEGLSPEQLGWAAGVSGHTIRRVERDGSVPTPRIQYAIATHFAMRPTDLWPLNRQRVAA